MKQILLTVYFGKELLNRPLNTAKKEILLGLKEESSLGSLKMVKIIKNIQLK